MHWSSWIKEIQVQRILVLSSEEKDCNIRPTLSSPSYRGKEKERGEGGIGEGGREGEREARKEGGKEKQRCKPGDLTKRNQKGNTASKDSLGEERSQGPEQTDKDLRHLERKKLLAKK